MPGWTGFSPDAGQSQATTRVLGRALPINVSRVNPRFSSLILLVDYGRKTYHDAERPEEAPHNGAE